MVDHVRPTILVFHNDQIRPEQLTELLLGVEEEGIPFEVRSFAELSPLSLGHQAAIASRLGLGIGVSLNYVVITTEKLPEDSPYIASEFNCSAERDRTLGGNAARIVKRMPLADLAACA